MLGGRGVAVARVSTRPSAGWISVQFLQSSFIDSLLNQIIFYDNDVIFFTHYDTVSIFPRFSRFIEV